MKELELNVVVDPKVDRVVTNSLAFGDFELAEGSSGAVYPDEVEGLPLFYSDLIMGKPFPMTLVTRGVQSLSMLLSVTLFLYRDLAIHPKTPSLVAATTLVERLEYAGLAHIDRDLARFFLFLIDYLPPKLGRKDQQSRLQAAVGWLRQYVIEGSLPALPPEPPPPRMLDHGADGFVVGEMPGERLAEGWIEFFRQGHLRGILVGSLKDHRRPMLVARKSPHVGFDLAKAAVVLNEAEKALDAPGEWLTDEGGLWLWGPEGGTLLPLSAVLEVLIRVLICNRAFVPHL